MGITIQVHVHININWHLFVCYKNNIIQLSPLLECDSWRFVRCTRCNIMRKVCQRRDCDRMVVAFTTTYAISALSPLMLWVRISIRARCTTWCDKVCQWLATCWWFPPVSSTNKTDHHDIAEILLKVVLNTITLTPFKWSIKGQRLNDLLSWIPSQHRKKVYKLFDFLFHLKKNQNNNKAKRILYIYI